MEWNWPQVLGVVIGICLVVGVLAKFVIADWLEKSKELEQLKAKQIKIALERLEEDVSKFEGQISRVVGEMSGLSGRLAGTEKKLSDMGMKLEQTVSELHGMALQIKSHVNEVVKSELIALSDKAAIIKRKRD